MSLMTSVEFILVMSCVKALICDDKTVNMNEKWLAKLLDKILRIVFKSKLFPFHSDIFQ